MIVFPYLSKRNIVKKSTQLAVTTSTLMLVYCAGFSGLSLLSHQIVLNSYGIVELFYSRIEVGTKIMDWTVILSQFLQIPFKFYLGREFVLILLDELSTKSLSKKLDSLQLSMDKYSQSMVERVNDDFFKVLRMPYMKSSKRWYYTVTIGTYAINLLIVLLIHNLYPSEDSDNNPVQCIVSVSAALIQPLIVYSLSGWLYYKTCVNYDIK